MEAFDLVPIAQIHDVVLATVGPVLKNRGFEVQKPLHWVRSDCAPIRHVFCLRQWKGGAISPCWGFSLDFVPHISGSAVKWHRTHKSALLDIGFDAHDRSLEFSYMKGVGHISSQAPLVVPRALVAADEFWSAGGSLKELLEVFEAVKNRTPQPALGFYNHTQYPLAFAFCLARAGKHDQAQQELSKVLIESPETEAKIRRLLHDAGST